MINRKLFPGRRCSASMILGWGFLVSAVLFTFLTARSAWAGQPSVRPSALAGTWYPGDPDQLTRVIKQYLDSAQAGPVPGRLVALVAPHAGYIYSGPVAGYTYSLLKRGQFKTVVLIGPSHRSSFPGVSVNRQDYETPLGRAVVDRVLSDEILKLGGDMIASRTEVHRREHCLEIQLPFLQLTLGQVKIVPLLMGDQDAATCRALAKVLVRAVKGKQVLLLASTDLSHFYPAEKAEALDRKLVQYFKAFDPEMLHQELAAGRVEACGGGPLVTVMMAARDLGADRATVLRYAHSGHSSGDNSRVVGYLAAVLTQTGKTEAGYQLSPADQRRLLTLARQALKAAVDKKEFKMPSDLPPTLMKPLGAFVTLKRQGALRGCIGRLRADEPLARVVADMAVAAGLKDTRFPPVAPAELEDLEVEISVLTPFRYINDIGEIKVGRDGLLVVHGYRQGLLLPQVPLEYGWDREEFLARTCRKAGLPAQAWKDEIELYSFQAFVFNENQIVDPDGRITPPEVME